MTLERRVRVGRESVLAALYWTTYFSLLDSGRGMCVCVCVMVVVLVVSHKHILVS